MIVDNIPTLQKPMIFIHIPKTGGMSCMHYLGLYRFIDHTTLKDDYEVLKEKSKDPESLFSFTIIRNPWERMVSNYFFHRHREHNDRRLHKKIEKSKLEQWISDHKKENKFWRSTSFKDWLKYFDENQNLQFVSIYDNIIKMNYLDYISMNDKIAVDYIIYLPNILKEIILIKETARISTPYPHANKSDHKDYREYYDSESIEIVAKCFAKDIEAFNFKFDDKSYCEHEKYWNHDKIKKFSKRIPVI